LDLAVKVGPTCLDLVRLGITVLGRTALEHVAYVHVLAVQPDHPQQLVQESARSADEGFASSILVKPRRFADEHDVSVLRTSTRDGVAPGAVKGALGAGSDGLTQVC
jgi:hypothetical protein